MLLTSAKIHIIPNPYNTYNNYYLFWREKSLKFNLSDNILTFTFAISDFKRGCAEYILYGNEFYCLKLSFLFYSLFFESMRIVTGPSLHNSTFMSAPNTPR